MLRLGRVWVRWILATFRVRIEAAGLENVPTHAPVILMSNHQSVVDIAAIVMTLPRTQSWRFVAKRELTRVPIFGQVPRRERPHHHRSWAIGTRRRQPARGREPHPGGHERDRVSRGHAQLGRPSAARSRAVRSTSPSKPQVPIVPVTVSGSQRITPKRRLLVHPGTVKIVYGKPIPTRGVTIEARKALADRVRQAIACGYDVAFQGRRRRSIPSMRRERRNTIARLDAARGRSVPCARFPSHRGVRDVVVLDHNIVHAVHGLGGRHSAPWIARCDATDPRETCASRSALARAGARRRRSEEPSAYGRLAAESIGLVLIAFAAVTALALATYSPDDPLFRLTDVANSAGAVGATLAGLLFRTAGLGGVVLVGVAVVVGARLVLRRGLPGARFWTGAALLLLSAATLPPLVAQAGFDLFSGSAASGLLGVWLASGERMLLSLGGALLLNVLLGCIGALAVAGVENGTALRFLARGLAHVARVTAIVARAIGRGMARAGAALWHALEAIGDATIDAVVRARDAALRGVRSIGVWRARRDRRAHPLSPAVAGAAAAVEIAEALDAEPEDAEEEEEAEAPQAAPARPVAQAGRPAHRRSPGGSEEEEPGAGSLHLLREHAAGPVPASRHRDLPAPARRRAQLRPRQPDHELADPREEARGLRRRWAAS